MLRTRTRTRTRYFKILWTRTRTRTLKNGRVHNTAGIEHASGVENTKLAYQSIKPMA